MDDLNISAVDADKPDTGIANPAKVNGAETDRMDANGAAEPGTDTVNPVEVDKAEVDGAKADKAEANGAEAGGAEADGAETSGADKPNIRLADPADLAEIDKADKRGTGIADPANLTEAGRVDEQGTSITNSAEPDKAKADGIDKPDTGLAAEDLRRRPVERQAAALVSFFSFHKVICLFFSSLESKTSGFFAIS